MNVKSMSYTCKVLWTVWELDVEDYEILLKLFLGVFTYRVNIAGTRWVKHKNKFSQYSIRALTCRWFCFVLILFFLGGYKVCKWYKIENIIKAANVYNIVCFTTTCLFEDQKLTG